MVMNYDVIQMRKSFLFIIFWIPKEIVSYQLCEAKRVNIGVDLKVLNI